MNDIMIKEEISSMIYEIRGKNVILDSDIAKLYGVETKRINEVIRRNKEKFSSECYFRLTNDESDKLLVAFCDQKNIDTRGGRYKNPRVFTCEVVSLLGNIMRGQKIKDETQNILDEFNKLENDNTIVIKGQNINNMIYKIRGKQVMLDYDLANLYQVATKRINEAVRNNPDKFPLRFCFQITKNEYENIFLRSKISTSNDGRGGRRYYPYAFTEHGVIMLATILKSEVAIEASIKIVDAFVSMKKYISYVSLPERSITNMLLKHDEKISKLEKAFDEFKEKEVITEVYFDGQIYDAYSKILSIFMGAKEKLIVIDSYADNKLLDIIKDVIYRSSINNYKYTYE